ncbi:MAG: hypothetical protein H7339_18680 [Arcicella sp.]|nr:hypothetical protein [Arcicella sp.]
MKVAFLFSLGEIVTETGFVVKGVFRIYYFIEGKESTRFLGCENILSVQFQVLQRKRLVLNMLRPWKILNY